MFIELTKNLEMIKQPNYRRMFKLSLWVNLFLIGLFVTSFIRPIRTIYRVKEKIVERMVPEDITLTDSAILAELVKGNCMLPNIALAQAKLETGHYKSVVCKENKNLFGIKKHNCKYVAGDNLNHATYKTYRDNIKCYLHIQEHYLSKINGKYAESPTYIQNLRIVK